VAQLRPTRRDPARLTASFQALAVTRRPPSAGAPEPADSEPPRIVSTELPSELTGRLTLLRWLEVGETGEQEQMAVVRDGRFSKPRALKLYRRGTEPEPALSAAWSRLRHPNVVRLHEYGTAGGRQYELMDLAGEPLDPDNPSSRHITARDLLGEYPAGLPEAMAVGILQQVISALGALYRAGIAHLDLKPDNLLLSRQLTPEVPPGHTALKDQENWAVTLIDFGQSVLLDQDKRFEVTRAISGWSPPEALARTVTRRSDCWSLGILTAELATGTHPLLEASPQVAQLQLSTHNIPWPDGLKGSLLDLYRGLVITAPDARWAPDQLTDWPVDLPQPAAPETLPGPADPFVFNGVEFRHLPLLAAAMQEAWNDAAALMDTPTQVVPLAEWLQQFDREGREKSGPVVARLDRLKREEGWSTHARLLLLLCWADPSLRPRGYRGVRIDRDHVALLALLAMPDLEETSQDETGPNAVGAELPDPIGNAFAREVIEELWQWRLLRALDSTDGGRGLAEVDHRWRALEQDWSRLLAMLRVTGSTMVAHIEDLQATPLRVQLLRLAADPERAVALRHELAATRRLIRRDIGAPDLAFEEFVAAVLPPAGARGAEPARRELVGLLAVHLVAPVALNWARTRREQREEVLRDRRIRNAVWRHHERWRLLERPTALGWAAAGVGVVFVAACSVLIGTEYLPNWPWMPPVDGSKMTAAWAALGFGACVQAAAELWLAATIGAPYHRKYSLMAALVQHGGELGRRWGNSLLATAALLLLGAAVVLVLIVLMLTVPFVLPTALAVVHLWWVNRRYRRWLEKYRQQRSGALPPGDQELEEAHA
jgi:hypothetical protein